MRLWLFLLFMIANLSYASGTAIVYDETTSRFIDKDLSYISPVTTVYHSTKDWSRTELMFVAKKLQKDVSKFSQVHYITANNSGIPYFKNYDVAKILDFLNGISYPMSHILLLTDNLHSLEITREAKQEAKKRGIQIQTVVATTRHELETAVLHANTLQQGLILNYALITIENETGVYLTYKEITEAILRKNKKHVVVGLNRQNPVCLCVSHESMQNLDKGTLDFYITLNAWHLRKQHKRILLDGLSKAKEVIF